MTQVLIQLGDILFLPNAFGDSYPAWFQAHPFTDVIDHTPTEGLVVIRKPVAASPYLPDRC